MTSDDIKRMSQDIHNQDNAHTADPIFMVQEKKRIYGFDLDYADDTKVEFIDQDGTEVSEEERREAYEEALETQEHEYEPASYEKWLKVHAAAMDNRHTTDEEKLAAYEAYKVRDAADDFTTWCHDHPAWRAVGYQDHWVNVQPFFTRPGAEAYLWINGHNLKDPRIYVESAFRNAEWQAIRLFLQERGLETGWTSVRDALPSVSTTDLTAGDLYRSDKVLASVKTKNGRETYCAFLQYDMMGPPFEEPSRWKIADSEEWDLGDTVTHWRPLPAPPKE